MTKKRYPKNVATPVKKPEGANDHVPQHASFQHQTYQHKGPLPDPYTLYKYNEIVPDAAERILKMAEENAAHVRDIENKLLEAEISDNKASHRDIRRGQIGGMFSVSLFFILAGYALYLGYTTVAGVICSTTVIGLVTIFVTGRQQSPPEPTQSEG